MPVTLPSYLIPKNGATWFLVEDVYIKGGYQVRVDHADRDNINALNRKAGMLVLTQNDDKIWKLLPDLQTWIEFKAGGSGSASREEIEYTTDEIANNAFVTFDLDLGCTVVLLHLEVTAPLTVEAFETEARTDTNPYRFIPTPAHLEDDGRTLLANGEEVNNRRYTILANRDLVKANKIYFRITNNTGVATGVTLKMQYVALEKV